MFADKSVTDIAIPASLPDTGKAQHPACWAEVVHTAEDAALHRETWQALAGKAVEHNVFYEPWNLLAALNTVAAEKRLTLLYIYTRDRDRRLIGFFPFESMTNYKGMPCHRMRLLLHPHCFLCTPLVHSGYVDRCLQAFAEWLARYPRNPVFEFDRVSDSFRELLERRLRAQSVYVTVGGRYQRALFRPAANAETYLKEKLPTKSHREFRRKSRRIAERGGVCFRQISPGDDVEPWIRSFLELEQRGWKGRARTALACHDNDREFFEAITREAHGMGRLRMIGLYLKDQPVARPIAMSCKFLAGGDGSFTFKIAFDEEYHRYSPGMLLELKYVIQCHEQNSRRWMDSCAEPDHFMANRVWMDLRTVETVLAARGAYGRLVVAASMLARRVLVPLRDKWPGVFGKNRLASRK
jgi:CelD/BcsL family acetyltransferase involved in cellulose biosynthesis